MKALRQRNADEGIAVHQKVEPRVYAGDSVQGERIERSRKLVAKCMKLPRRYSIIELGCGTLDISGPFSERHNVLGLECNFEAMKLAKQRWPKAEVYSTDATAPAPTRCEILVLCEFLEHVPDPFALAKAWLPLADHVVISHPLNGDLAGDLSGKEHQWSFDETDFVNWFNVGGHELIEHEVFKMEGYDIILGRGWRAA